MASYELIPFQRFDDVNIITAIEQQSSLLNVGFWVKDPNGLIEWPAVQKTPSKADFLWQDTCFELFIGIRDQDEYLEINLSPAQLWQCYGFEEYRYPECIPPQKSQGAELIELKRTHYGMSATLDIAQFLATNKVSIQQVFVGISAVLKTTRGEQFYALQHSSPHADFHNKRDWLHQI
ncbi:DOMON domain-containing protein [Acinetobacter rathckeae]|uniref:hypothetical protein n=1 Tax=Acinetobacter rathckeae TaxID=2605272 RepID=UPI0018A2E124|nr:hypothetical protein [Acinetobacter rathckeae]MBF7686734.1 hypothetical protein [Acinetobacter rathckeae]MBF7695734.1 hypothetical protein [Acinetobacter rathckeae]